MAADKQKTVYHSSTRAFVDVAQAAKLLQLSEATIRHRCRLGKLPAIRVGREWQVELAALRQQIDGGPALQEL